MVRKKKQIKLKEPVRLREKKLKDGWSQLLSLVLGRPTDEQCHCCLRCRYLLVPSGKRAVALRHQASGITTLTYNDYHLWQGD